MVIVGCWLMVCSKAEVYEKGTVGLFCSVFFWQQQNGKNQWVSSFFQKLNGQIRTHEEEKYVPIEACICVYLQYSHQTNKDKSITTGGVAILLQ